MAFMILHSGKEERGEEHTCLVVVIDEETMIFKRFPEPGGLLGHSLLLTLEPTLHFFKISDLCVWVI